VHVEAAAVQLVPSLDPGLGSASSSGGGGGGGTALGSSSSPAEVLFEVLVAALASIRDALSGARGGGGGGGGGAEAHALQMAGVARMLLSKLQEQVRTRMWYERSARRTRSGRSR
jgi:hypothetical protein